MAADKKEHEQSTIKCVVFHSTSDRHITVSAEILAKLGQLAGVLDTNVSVDEAILEVMFDESMISVAEIKSNLHEQGVPVGGYCIKNVSHEIVPPAVQLLELTIGGMSCAGCEQRIENVLKQIPGVLKVQISYSEGSAQVTVQSGVTPDLLVTAINGLGYEVKNAATSVGSSPADFTADFGKVSGKDNESFSPAQLAGIGIILIAVWLILEKTGLFNLLPRIDESISLGLLLVVGLITSLHCLAMCGGINLSQSIKQVNNDTKNKMIKRATAFSQLIPGLLYNTGRVISYTLIGGIVGSLGSVISFSPQLQGILVLIAGFFMIIMGINILGIFPFLKRFSIRMPKCMGKLAEHGRSRGPFVVGLLNGFMPCGPLQSMQLYALGTGSFIGGATSMFLFSLGTVPLMFGFSVISSLLTARFTHRMMKISALLVLLLGTTMLGRGLSLNGINLNSNFPVNIDNIAQLGEGKQFVTSSLTNSSYEPIFVQAGLPVEWTILADENNLNGCNNPIIIPKYNIKQKLIPGENKIVFTPDQAGTIAFSCWMGMISGSIKVVEDLAGVDKNQVQEAFDSAAAQSGGGSCCASGGANNRTNQVPGLPDQKLNVRLDKIQLATIEDDTQSFTLELDEQGYSPAVFVVQKGLKTAWKLWGRQLDNENYRMIVPVYGSRIELKAGENNIDFIPETDFYFTSWNNVYHGFVKVVDDLTEVDLAKVRNELENYMIPAPGQQGGGGGCCGQ